MTLNTIDYEFSGDVLLRLQTVLALYLALAENGDIPNKSVSTVINYLYGLLREVNQCGQLSVYNVQNINVLLGAAKAGFFGEPLQYFNVSDINYNNIDLTIIGRKRSEYTNTTAQIKFYMDPTIKYVLFRTQASKHCATTARTLPIPNSNMLVEWPSTFTAHNTFTAEYNKFVSTFGSVENMSQADLEQAISQISPSKYFANVFGAFKRIYEKTITDGDIQRFTSDLSRAQHISNETTEQLTASIKALQFALVENQELQQRQEALLSKEIEENNGLRQANSEHVQTILDNSKLMSHYDLMVKTLAPYGGEEALFQMLSNIAELVGSTPNINTYMTTLQSNVQTSHTQLNAAFNKIQGLEQQLKDAIELSASNQSKDKHTQQRLITQLKDALDAEKQLTSDLEISQRKLVEELNNRIEELEINSDKFLEVQAFAVSLNRGHIVTDVKEFLSNLVYTLENQLNALRHDGVAQLLYGVGTIPSETIINDLSEIINLIPKTATGGNAIEQIKSSVGGIVKWLGLISQTYKIIKNINIPELNDLKRLIESQTGYPAGYLFDGVPVSTYNNLRDQYNALKDQMDKWELRFKTEAIAAVQNFTDDGMVDSAGASNTNNFNTNMDIDYPI